MKSDQPSDQVRFSAPPGRTPALLAYKRQFLVVDRYFVESLGLDPDDADWLAIGWDWAYPKDAEARGRLYGKFLAAQRAATA